MLILLTILLVLANGFFVAAEFALVKIRQSHLEQLEMQGNKKAKVTRHVVSNLNTYLNACQFGITLASLGLGRVGEPAIAHMIEPLLQSFGMTESTINLVAFIIGFSIVTILHIVLGEVVPKSIAIQKSDTISLLAATPLIWFYRIFYPAVWVLNALSNLTLKLIGMQPSTEHEAAHTEEELKIIAEHSHKSGHINETELNLIEGAFHFADSIVRHVMVPRVNMNTIDIESSYKEILQRVKEEQHTRYPVISEDKDHIVGFMHVKDLIDAGENFSIKDRLRTIVSVHESMETSEALKMMQRERTQIAIVIDEFGGTAGMITMEDLLEEIVGEIHDEFDQEEQAPVIEIEDKYSVVGNYLLTELEDMGFEIHDEEVDTIAGWLYKKSNGELNMELMIEENGWKYSIDVMEDNRISRVLIEKVA